MQSANGRDDHRLELEELNGDAEASPAASLALLYDLKLSVTVELGSTRMTVREVLALGRGSVVQLERLVGEPVELLVGGRRFAEGEVVVESDRLGVRITRMLGPAPFGEDV